jgi:hypothetical protein
MFNQIGKLEVKIGERVYQLLCAVDSPVGEVHDVLSQMKMYVIDKMKEIESPPIPEKLEE